MMGKIIGNFYVARKFEEYFAGKAKLMWSKVMQSWLPELLQAEMQAKIFLKKIQTLILLPPDFIKGYCYQ